MIDWLTLKLDRSLLSQADIAKVADAFGRVLCINGDGTIEWEKIKRECIRSDSHQLIVNLGYEFELHGSPARVLHTHNVFGSGDPAYCAFAMIQWAARTLGIDLPFDVTQWRCTRMDVTHNYDLGSACEVRQALSYLRQSEGGRYQVRTNSETVYWSPMSGLRSGKAYHKGPHLRHQAKKNQIDISPDQISLSDRLLRLELTLKSQYWRERSAKKWYLFSERELDQIHNDYFAKLIGKIEVIEMDNLLEQFEQVAPTKGRALAAYRTWGLIKSIGLREAQASMRRSTWFDHQKIMFSAGLTFADLHAQNVIPFRRRTIELGQPVRSWQELKQVA